MKIRNVTKKTGKPVFFFVTHRPPGTPTDRREHPQTAGNTHRPPGTPTDRREHPQTAGNTLRPPGTPSDLHPMSISHIDRFSLSPLVESTNVLPQKVVCVALSFADSEQFTEVELITHNEH